MTNTNKRYLKGGSVGCLLGSWEGPEKIWKDLGLDKAGRPSIRLGKASDKTGRATERAGGASAGTVRAWEGLGTSREGIGIR